MKLGDTFIWSPDGYSKAHLYIAVTDPNKNGGSFVIFNLTESHGGSKALTFKIGQHPFIDKYNSDINFGDGLITDLNRVDCAISLKEAIPHVPMRLEMVRQIAKFAINHPAVNGDIQDLILDEWKFSTVK